MKPRLAQVQVRQVQAIAVANAIPGTLAGALDLAREAVAGADAADLGTRSYARFVMGVASRDMGRLEEAVREHGAGAQLFATEAVGHEPGLVYPIFVSLCGWRSEVEACTPRAPPSGTGPAGAARSIAELRHCGFLEV